MYHHPQSSSADRYSVIHAGQKVRERYLKTCTFKHCSFKTPYAPQLERHLQLSHLKKKKKMFRCSSCEFSSNHFTTLKNHMSHCKKHIAKKEGQQFTEFTTNNVDIAPDVKSHVETKKTGETAYQCNVCSYYFANPGSLKRHLDTMHLEPEEREKLTERCAFPNCRFKTIHPTNLKRHLRRSHGTDKMTKSKTTGGPSQANNCNNNISKTIQTSLSYDDRNLSHVRKEGKEFACEFSECTFRTLYSTSLYSHLRFVHSVECSYEKGKKCCKVDAISGASSFSNNFNPVHNIMRESLSNYGTSDGRGPTGVLASMGCVKEEGFKKSERLKSKWVIQNWAAAAKDASKKLKSNGYKLELPESTHYSILKGVKMSLKDGGRMKSKMKSREDLSSFGCKSCGYKSKENQLLARHNEEVHSVPYVVLQLLPLPKS